MGLNESFFREERRERRKKKENFTQRMASFSSFRTAGNMQSSHLMSFSRPRKATPESAAEKRRRGNVSPVKVRREGVTRLRGQRRVNSSYEQYDSRRAAQLKKNAEVRKVAESKRGPGSKNGREALVT